ncbi:MAG: hypothetical protein GF417_07275 [Candidatus Latescibacteria bacterium]|nr:hypothetical protein [bacterium]MBD3424220.1 hypothetical protein [Candidatus Latescibacterota bacterium]
MGAAAVEFAKGEISWKKALRKHGVDPSFIHSPREDFPWHRIEGPVSEEQLRQKYLERG